MSDPKITGSCNCGRHTYTVPRATEMNLCHCFDCRKWAGAMHSAHMYVKTAEIDSHSSPQPRKHVVDADSGNTMERAWCDKCGCGLFLRNRTTPEMTYFKAGLFKNEDIPQPTMENWLQNARSWETPATGTKRQAQGN